MQQMPVCRSRAHHPSYLMLTLKATVTLHRRAWYCSQDCQRQEWPTHKIYCPSLSSAMQKMQRVEYHEKKAHVEMLSKWMTIWARTIQVFGFLGMNFPSNPDIAATHG